MRPLLGIVASATIVPFYLLIRHLWPAATTRFTRLFYYGIARSLRIHIQSEGTPTHASRVLFVCNHLSWCDIPVLGAKLNARFVAKAEVADWGPIGWLASRADTIYVARERRRDAGAQSDMIAAHLASGGNVILFPEGTTSDGRRIQHFRSALFAAAGTVPDALIQPISLAYTALDGMPITRSTLPHIVWMGDVGIGAHALRLARGGRLCVVLRFHPPVAARDFPNRKALAIHCERAVAAGYVALMRGQSLSTPRLPI